ncbi:uncharacterized protein LOC143264088 [Megachile rotundata]|uniref:uncharacterized protein LOC143264088 n=1 Tax=Megachile rotundata TaxID=143995 RepID=UPI003FD58158
MPKEPSVAQSASQGINVSSLRRKRGNIVGHITTLEKVIEGMRASEKRDLGLLRTHVQGMHEIWERFDAVQFELEELDETEAPRRFEIHGKYITAIAQANALIEGERSNITSRRDTSDSVHTVTAPMAIKLPEMRLPTFDGSIENWTSYFDSFTSMIDQNPDLTPVQKLQYLRSTLTGRAAASIQCLSTTDANYIDAIELLKEKYDCRRKILIKHCDAILSFPRLSRDSPESLGELVDTIRQNLRSLKNLRVDLTSWDSILITIILSKISTDTAWHWELSLKDKEMPSYKNLIDFLEKRASCAPTNQHKPVVSIQNLRTTPMKPSSYKYPTKPHAFVTTTTFDNSQTRDRLNPTTAPSTSLSNGTIYTTATVPANCPVCNGPHGIWRCEKFHSSSIDARIATVREAALCPNCLRSEHNPEICRKGSCRICRQPHHTLLHQPRRLPDQENLTLPKSTKHVITSDAQVEDQ